MNFLWCLFYLHICFLVHRLHTKKESHDWERPDEQMIDGHRYEKGEHHGENIFHQNALLGLHYIIHKDHDDCLMQYVKWIDRLVEIIEYPVTLIQILFTI